MKWWIGGLAASLILTLGAGPARAAATVFGGGMAEDCSKAAKAGAFSLHDEAICTRAIDEEMLGARDRAGTLVNRGIMRLRRKEWSSALQDFDIAAAYAPSLGDIYVNRGAALIGARRFEDGVAELNKGLSLGCEEPEKAYYDRALAYEALDDMKSAYFDYQKALELKPDWDAPKEQLTRFHVSRRE